MDIGVWLRRLGLEEYASAFLDNAIDTEVLRDLTADDLKDLGVNLVGHRRKLLAAIAALKREVSPAPNDGAVEQAAAPSSTALRSPTEAQRRQLTVMFCDLVGSTALSGKLDPEDMREVLGVYHAGVSEQVAHFDGFVAKFMGDGVLAYFGYPQAHEDDAERAIRTALAIIERVGTLKPASGILAVRIGIATGLVVVGDLIGSGEAQERAVVGETPNLAARLQAMAEPNGVLIAGATRQLVGDLFEYREIGLVEIRGFDDSVPVWQVLRPSTVESRFEALRTSRLTPLVGRGEEADLLLRRWHRAKSSEGQIVLISGEPGIGKSRLVAALQDRLEDEPDIRLRYFCSPHHRNSTLNPFISQLERAAGFDREDTSETRLDKLEALLGQSGERGSEIAALFADLLSVPTGSRYPPSPADPQRRRELTLAALLDQLELLSQQRPVLMMFEDAHWADSTSLELLDRAVERTSRLPVMIVITFRPEFAAPWVGQAHVTSMGLTRLAQRETTALVDRVTGGKALPAEILDRIVDRTDGIPLFIEELTKTLLESGLLREEETSYILTGPLPPLAIPSSLQASLLARLDRLMPVKEVAQIGAALGREFSYGLVAAVAWHSDAELRKALDQLTESGLVFRRGNPPHATFMFKHALVQDAAYSTLLRSQRLELHARIGKVLEDQFPEIAEGQPEILAHQFTEAGLVEKALAYWLQAGRRAAARSANVEAIGHLRHGLELLSKVIRTDERELHELALLLAIGGPLISAQGYAARETVDAFTRARVLCSKLDDNDHLLPVLYGEWAAHYVRADYKEMRELQPRFDAISKQSARSGLTLIATRMLALDRFHSADLAGARILLENVLDRYCAAEHLDLAYQFGHDIRAASLCYLTWTLWVLGYPDRALEISDAAISWGSGLIHANSKGIALCWGGCMPMVFLREPTICEERGRSLRQFCDDARLPLWGAYGLVYLGWAQTQQGDPEGGLELINTGLADLGRTGSRRLLPLLLCLKAEAELKAGHDEAALKVLAQAADALDSTGDPIWTTEVFRLRAAARSRAGNDLSTQEHDLRRALDVAQDQHAKSLELRAATSLARLWGEHGRRTEACDLLAPVYGWFTEGFDTPDLIDAKALLEELT